MPTVNVHAAKTHLSRLVERALAGEDIVIARAGKPVVRLVPVKPGARRSGFGSLKGRVRIADDFDAPLPAELLRRFGVRR
jgi:prevent-host-death family protein